MVKRGARQAMNRINGIGAEGTRGGRVLGLLYSALGQKAPGAVGCWGWCILCPIQQGEWALGLPARTVFRVEGASGSRAFKTETRLGQVSSILYALYGRMNGHSG